MSGNEGSNVLRGASSDESANPLRPDLAAEWHPEKNGDLTPQDVTAGSGKHVWWVCPEGHEWKASVFERSRGSGCPYCAGSKTLPGFNDLATVRPDLAAEWHPGKNGDLTPQDVTASSGRNVWWVCSEGHEWRTKVARRSLGSGCPFCAGRRVLPGFNDLATVRPDLAAEWHPEKNGDLTPQDVTAGSHKRVWWVCREHGHEWVALVYDRDDGHGCPFCAGRRVLPGFNDLATVRPDLAAEWHPEKNGDLTPQDVTAGSHKRVWWVCREHGHEWEAEVSKRSVQGCPYCGGRRFLSGFNDLATVRPDLAAEWHPGKNGDLTPEDVSVSSNRKVWWKCAAAGHEWHAAINGRVRNPVCPICAMAPYSYLSRLRKTRFASSLGHLRIGCDLKEHRKQAGLTQAALADLLGVDRATIRAIESGNAEPSVGVALAIAQVLDCGVEDVFHILKGHPTLLDLTNVRFGSLVAKRRLPVSKSSGDRSAVWACLCDCGGVCQASAKGLRAGWKRDCGCGIDKAKRAD